MNFLITEEQADFILMNEDLRRWFKEKWVDVSRKVKGKHPECGRDKATNKSYPKCRPSKKISKDTPKLASSFSKEEKKKISKKKRSVESKSKKVGTNNKPNIVK